MAVTQDKESSLDFSQTSFEQGMAELEQLVVQLESSNIGLEDSVRLYERGQALHQYLAAILKNTAMRIEKIGQASGESTGKSAQTSASDGERSSADGGTLPF